MSEISWIPSIQKHGVSALRWLSNPVKLTHDEIARTELFSRIDRTSSVYFKQLQLKYEVAQIQK